MIAKALIALLAMTCIAGLAGKAEAALESRLGGLAWYDSTLDVSWATDASLGATEPYFVQRDALSTLTIGGVGDWRMPTLDVDGNGVIVDCSGGAIGCADNELGYMFAVNGVTSAAPGPFSEVAESYWVDPYDLVLGFAHLFSMSSGADLGVVADDAPGMGAVWAVRDGDVGPAPVPLPAAAWSLGAGLLALHRLSRVRRDAPSPRRSR
ncbi:MAG: hypothetical protein H6977_10080 [Gammaproteobacteria bacterium]|nr:hypothetical protein [Gammaproteobacteria bacterium]MCP5200354.1 hypothetical protein [Gammaproteobacteria bacterium]